MEEVVEGGDHLDLLTMEEEVVDLHAIPPQSFFSPQVPTRGYLKRQSNLILDAKSRSKRGGRKR